jgi:uncharacterized membrane protein
VSSASAVGCLAVASMLFVMVLCASQFAHGMEFRCPWTSVRILGSFFNIFDPLLNSFFSFLFFFLFIYIYIYIYMPFDQI